jgi:hypothetical protein
VPAVLDRAGPADAAATSSSVSSSVVAYNRTAGAADHARCPSLCDRLPVVLQDGGVSPEEPCVPRGKSVASVGLSPYMMYENKFLQAKKQAVGGRTLTQEEACAIPTKFCWTFGAMWFVSCVVVSCLFFPPPAHTTDEPATSYNA